METKSRIDNLLSHVKDYAEERMRLIALSVHDKSSRTVSGVALIVVLLLLGIFIIFFLSVALAWWIGSKLEAPGTGFLLVGLLYIIVSVVVYLNRERWIREPVLNIFLKTIADEED